MKELEQLERKNVRTKMLQFLRYSRRDREYGIEKVLVIALGDQELEEMVERQLKKAKRRGAIYYEGKFEKLQNRERQRIYDEAKKAVMKWFEVECECCGEILDLFEDDVFRFKWENEEQIQCRECFGKYGDDPVNDELLAKAIRKRKPFYKLFDENTALVAKKGRRELELIFKRKHPLSLQAIKQFGREVK